MKIVPPEIAIQAIPDNSNVIMPGGCAEPVNVFEAFAANVERFNALTVYSGFGFGRYAYLKRGLGAHFRYVTWQASGTLRELFKENDRRKVGFAPIRLADLNRIVSREGPIKPHVVVVQTSIPQSDGTVSLGGSVGAMLDFVTEADLVIAEFNMNVPVTGGESRFSIDRIHYATESATPLATYSTPPAKPRDEQIVQHVMDLVPDNAWVQLGLGAVPDRVLNRLADKRNVNLFSGLLTGGLLTYLDRARHSPQVTAGELAGDKAFYEFCHQETRIKMAPLRVTHEVATLAALPRFVSINSAVEIDLQGQSNGETLGALQISGVGGSMDYVEAAAQSRGGISIIALPSTTDDGKHSKIVPRLAAGAPVTTPRFAVDCIITEYGVAHLKGRDLWARAEALIAIAHPDFRDGLANSL
ncbi:MAG: hypothetical protein EXR86_01090 [Gammaproteobacteria bacterium]|nr:hypothetical protein [Gammaproteobacteria bacterium]